MVISHVDDISPIHIHGIIMYLGNPFGRAGLVHL
jgi:hypothetical protein